jgi:hypothetical protein
VGRRSTRILVKTASQVRDPWQKWQKNPLGTKNIFPKVK